MDFYLSITTRKRNQASGRQLFIFDSIIDDKQRLSQDDSLFEKTHYRSSVSSDSVLGDDYPFQNNSLLPPNQLFRPLQFTVLVAFIVQWKTIQWSAWAVSSILFWLQSWQYICATDARRTCSLLKHRLVFTLRKVAFCHPGDSDI